MRSADGLPGICDDPVGILGVLRLDATKILTHDTGVIFEGHIGIAYWLTSHTTYSQTDRRALISAELHSPA